MDYITFDNIKIEGIVYQRIIDLQVEQKIGEHAKAILVIEQGENSYDMNNLEDTVVQVFANTLEKIECIFCGSICKCDYAAEKGYSAVRIELLSMSKQLDIEPVTATYQQTTISYQDLMEKVAESRAIIHFGATDTTIGSWRYRNNETAWAFIKRLASQCNASVMTNMSTTMPILSIGQTDKNMTDTPALIDTYELDGRIVYRTNIVLELGTKLSGSQYVIYAKTYFKDAILVTDYILGTMTDMKQNTYYNEQSACKMLTGTVKKVEREKVQVYFDSIDSTYDESGDCWFEYATPYATNGGAYGSGFYFMPEEEDKVRVFLPSADEGEAFAFGTVSESSLKNPEYAQWKTPGKQQILFTDKGVRLSCEGVTVYIDMKAEEGINVWSATEINLENAESIEIDGKNGVIMHADNIIAFKSSEACITIENDKIIFDSVDFKMD